MSKETALAMTSAPVAEAPISPVTGIVKDSPNPAIENGGIVPQPLVSTQITHLAKKEQKLLEEREVFKKEMEAFKEREAKVKEVWEKATAFEETRKKDPIKALRDIGFTEKEIVDYLSQEETPKLSTEEVVQIELKKFKEEEAKKVKEEQAKKDQGEIQRFKNRISSVILSNPEKYELCAYNGPAAEEIMFGIALEEAKSGVVSTPEQLAEEVEEFYLEQFEQMKKLKKLTPKQEALLEGKEPIRSRVVHAPQEVVKPKTITNKMTVTSAALAKPSDKIETPKEKRARLEAMIRNGWVK